MFHELYEIAKWVHHDLSGVMANARSRPAADDRRDASVHQVEADISQTQLRVFRRVSDAFSHPWGRPLPFLSFFCSLLFSPFSSTHSLARLTRNLFLAGYLESANNCTIITWHEIPVWKPPVFHSLNCSSSVFSPPSSVSPVWSIGVFQGSSAGISPSHPVKAWRSRLRLVFVGIHLEFNE